GRDAGAGLPRRACDDVRAPAAGSAPGRRRAVGGRRARRVRARAADGDDVRAVRRITGLVGARVTGREVEGGSGRSRDREAVLRGEQERIRRNPFGIAAESTVDRDAGLSWSVSVVFAYFV